MAKIPRILAKAVDGPLNGMYFSVQENQETIEGFNDMSEGSQYVKDETSQRDFQGEEEALVKLLFDSDQHDLSQICKFRYNAPQ